MQTVIQVIGIFVFLAGILFLVKPAVIKQLIVFLQKGYRIYFVGMLRIALAIVFLLGARQCDMTRVIVVLAILFLLSGLSIFMLGSAKIRRILEWYLRQPLFFLRVLALIPLILGGLITYAA
jgi:hypothetical protein